MIGPFELGKRNEKSNILIDFWKQHRLVVMNMWFKIRKTELYTWKSPGDRKLYQIYYILVKLRFRNNISDIKTLHGSDIDSDHNLLVEEVQKRSIAIKKS